MLTAIAIFMFVLAAFAAALAVLAYASRTPAFEGTRYYEPSPAWRVVAIVAAAVTSVMLVLAALGTWLTAVFA